ncbi:uncharacterized protein N7500_010051 [Penicillium coprophilum]|uniref:uncharacterized protein n=1 Tax=Penicillium coprophilum TaxID=36646 RepID=UPI002387E34C|nr:uncharacterized protein N7500_010051 [Penicillium coprophilum]KAJ5154612.1 hypothetical protein N7500_010051 [Penicillium coprophilum]
MAEDDPEHDGVMVVKVTGQGAESLARTWCSERGKNSVIRLVKFMLKAKLAAWLRLACRQDDEERVNVHCTVSSSMNYLRRAAFLSKPAF